MASIDIIQLLNIIAGFISIIMITVMMIIINNNNINDNNNNNNNIKLPNNIKQKKRGAKFH